MSCRNRRTLYLGHGLPFLAKQGYSSYSPWQRALRITVNIETHSSGHFLIKRQVLSQPIILIPIYLFIHMSLYHIAQMEAEGFETILLVFPSTTQE